MLNFHDTVRTAPHIHKLEIGDLLFAQYTCALDQAEVGMWTPMDYLVHVVSGRKVWRTSDGEWEMTGGQTMFFRKGACVVRQDFSADFCVVVFFVPDGFVREVVRELAGEVPMRAASAQARASAMRVSHDISLEAFLGSMLAYFAGDQRPPTPVLRLKMKELIVSILAGAGNPDLAAYLLALARRGAPSVGDIMEANFRYNLTLAEYAALCHRSLSSFKRDFQGHFGEAPGRWLLHRRLDHARRLLEQPGVAVTEAALESGFEEVSHFSRAFKARFGLTPSAVRATGAAAVRSD